jgi:divalent metal cation (Fe/Co/Zn/Cd) transporter
MEMRAFFDRWGNFSSVVGLVVSLIGFVWTLIIVWKSKTAAQKAEEAASTMKEVLLKSESLTNCSAAISIIEEIRTFHREGG